ncbi:MAG TPA: serine/threonine-protein kinase, partial [Planctomycetaceae bacterium]|nr:serine/threonine-protein kinase [Planctomycetaceae bacterium]
KLDHPNICRVYDAGEIGGTPFITMEYIDGPPLSQFIGVGEFTDQRRIAEIISAVASGLAHAHEQGILHRDLKPGNVLMKGSTIPCVTDFGLARSVDAGEESRLTQDGMILGTPAYMAPEQIEAQADTVGPTADVYALGGMFYEMLTGRIPFQGSVMSILAQALRDLPKPPSKLRSDIDSKLEDLCLQMMDKSPAKRPASMQEVVKRMQSWLEQTSQATQAERQKAKQTVNRLDEMKARIVDQIQRGQFAAAVAGLKKLADVKTPDAADYVAWARKKLPEVQKMPKRLREGLPALVSTAEICMRAHDYAQASQLLVDIPEDFMTDEARSVLNQAIQLQDESDLLLADLKRCVQTKQYLGIEDNLKRFLELKPGNRFARDLWDSLNTYQRIPQSQRKFRYDKRGKLQPLLEDNFLRSWLFWGAVCFAAVFGLMTWGITIYLRDGDQQLAVSVNEDWLKEQGGQLTLAVDGKDHTISAGKTEVTVTFGDHGFSVKHGDSMVHNPQTFAIEKGTTQVLHIDASGMHVAAAENPPLPPDPDPAPIVINAPLTPLPDGPAGLVKSLNGHKGVVSQVAWSPDGRTVASVSSTDGTLRVWDVETGGERHQSKCLLGYALAIHPDGKLVATSSPHEPGGHAMTIYNMETGKKVAETPQVAKPILSAMFSADGQYFAIHCRDGAGIHVYDVSQLPDVRVAAELPGGDSGWAVSLAFLPDSQQLLAGSSGEKYGLRLFDVATQREIRSYRERNGAKCSNIMPSIAVHPSGKQFHVFSNSSYRLTELNVFNDTAVRA